MASLYSLSWVRLAAGRGGTEGREGPADELRLEVVGRCFSDMMMPAGMKWSGGVGRTIDFSDGACGTGHFRRDVTAA